MVKKIGVLTSGGDSPGMNAAIRAVVRSAQSYGITVYGIYDGYRGLVENRMFEMGRYSVSETLGKGGTILGSARLPEFKQKEVREKAVENLKAEGIEALVVIGGDGSYRGALELTRMGINCIGLPGTIDNDIASTEFTIGFITALNTIVDAVDKLRDTSSSHKRCSVVEVMGNRCGDLAIWAGICTGAEIVVTPQTGFDEDDVINQLNYFHDVRKKNHAIVIISEKMTDVEAFAKKISKYTGFDGRATVLGHVQRGGGPSPFDRVLASRLADRAVQLLNDNIGGQCVGMIDNKVVNIPFEEALDKPRSSRKELYSLFERLV
ncbi:MAG: 6-phosphofructokinase [Erysipelotrichales bacterium]|nr:6-phosphofructokinase [Erysipelotrichales bacterium]